MCSLGGRAMSKTPDIDKKMMDKSMALGNAMALNGNGFCGYSKGAGGGTRAEA